MHRKRVASNQTGQAVNLKAKARSAKQCIIREVFLDYVALHGQFIPNSEEVHLQRGITKTHVYDSYKCSMKRWYPDEPVASRDAVCTIWRQEFRHVKTRPSTNFAVCDTCDRCRAILSDITISKETVEKVKEFYKQHLKDQREARELYYHHNHLVRKPHLEKFASSTCFFYFHQADEKNNVLTLDWS